jgi:hypothetical protein
LVCNQTLEPSWRARSASARPSGVSRYLSARMLRRQAVSSCQ